MKQSLTIIVVLLCCTLFWNCKPNRSYTEKEISIIPQPQKMTLGVSSFRFKESTELAVESVDQEEIARFKVFDLRNAADIHNV